MRKTKLTRRALACAWVLAVAAGALGVCAARAAAQGGAQAGATASVVGRVTDGKRGLAGVAVGVTADGAMPWSAESVSAKTDAEGRYRVSGLAPGRYRVTPVAPAHVFAENDDARRGRALLLAAGETVENIDFRLVRGGVITGRVTGADGRPLVGEFVRITIENTSQPAHAFARPDRMEMTTDDRGVYRVYGLPAGRYRVSVGADGPPRGPRGTTTSGEKTFNQRTYYPDTTEAAEAKLVEVTEGGETGDIDIRVAKATRQTYAVAGRIVFAETSQPAANVRVGWAPAGRAAGGGRAPFFNFAAPAGAPGAVVTDARGEFKLEGFVSGRYVAFGVREGSPDWYSEQTLFEVSEADAEGVEVKLRRGASVSGVLQFEGVTDRATVAGLLGRARIFATSQSAEGETPGPGASVSTTVNADGTFRFSGLLPGRVRFSIAGRETGLVLLRVEHNGAPVERGVEVAEGAQVAGVRVVAGHGNAVVRGQISVTGGTLEAGLSLRVFARRVGDTAQGSIRVMEADSRGLFVIENLVAGEYELNAGAWPLNPRAPGGAAGGRPPQRGNGFAGPRQRVTVAPGGDHTVTLVLPVGRNTNPNGIPNGIPNGNQ